MHRLARVIRRARPGVELGPEPGHVQRLVIVADGVQGVIPMTSHYTCSTCGGTGTIGIGSKRTCPSCRGTGSTR